MAEVGAWAALSAADRLVLPTLFAYGPRWLSVVPPLVLLPSALFRQRRVVPLTLSLMLAVGPIMQFQLPSSVPAWEHTARLTVLTLNTDGVVPIGRLFRAARDAQADLIVLQECRSSDPEALAAIFGWPVRSAGSLCVVSRYPVISEDVVKRPDLLEEGAAALALVIDAPMGKLSLFNVHLETVREGIEALLPPGPAGLRTFSANHRFRDLESRAVSEAVARAPHPVIVAGDFNAPTDSAIYRTYWRPWSNAVDPAGVGFGFTKYTSWWGTRIDHVLYGPEWRAIAARTGRPLESDHRAMIVTLQPAG